MKRASWMAVAAAALLTTSCAMITHGKGNGKCPLPDESGFERREFRVPGSERAYPLYVTRGGRAPFLMLHPLGGLDPCTLELCKELEAKGWRVHAPILDGGTYGERNIPRSFVYVRNAPHWKLTNPRDCGEILDDMRALVQSISRESGGRRVVVMGNCLTGAFPWGMLDLPAVSTAVLCQPALPIKEWAGDVMRDPGALAIPKTIEADALAALRRDPTKRIVGFHYYEDPVAPYRKFEVLHEKLGPDLADRFRPVVVLRGSSQMQPPDWWDAPALRTSIRPSLSEPHSTVSGAMDPGDRSRLRKRFFELLGPAPY